MKRKSVPLPQNWGGDFWQILNFIFVIVGTEEEEEEKPPPQNVVPSEENWDDELEEVHDPYNIVYGEFVLLFYTHYVAYR